ncbi:DMT family transporter [Pseudolysinimonas sp.]|uniref:DMT family transporter n=1 Tax=Pseudolysinimonas sp. TaxID=2680009 RepID=UPI00286D4CFE|nr:DMT family transporter [Pseudolysinimonas sp.]
MAAAPPIPPAAAPGRLAFALVAAFGTGTLVALQTRLNGELGQRLGDGFLAAFISFGSGFVILAVAALVWRPGRRGMVRVARALRERTIPWWLVLGGAGGAFFVLGQGLTVGVLGVALFTIAVVCGQTVSSLLLDHRGLALMPATSATPQRVIGAALAVVAVGIAVSDRLRPDAPYLAVVIPLAAGLFVGWQQAVNGQVRQVSGSAFTATLGNFLAGTVVLGIALLVHTAVAGWNPDFPADWWLYLGGLVGCVFIASQAVIVRTTGVLLMSLALLGGQLVASVVFDLFAPVSGTGLHLVTAIGSALVLVAVVVAAFPVRAVRAS